MVEGLPDSRPGTYSSPRIASCPRIDVRLRIESCSRIGSFIYSHISHSTPFRIPAGDSQSE